MIRVDEQNERVSDDSSFNSSSTSIENFNKFSLPKKQSNSRKRLITSWKNPRFIVGRRESLVDCLKDKITQPRLRRKLKPAKAKPDSASTSKHESTGNDYIGRADGDTPGDEGHLNQAQLVHPSIVQQQGGKEREGSPSSGQVFPFDKTPSGNFKLKPSQIVYKSRNLSVLAADPHKVVLNVTSLNRTEEPERDTKHADFEKPGISRPSANIKDELGIPINSEFSDSTVQSDNGPLNKDGSTEIALARMGFVTDNCIEWNKIQLPKKSDLNKLVMQNIVNKVNPDVRIKIGNTRHTFDCHRIVLQCYSVFFSAKSENVIVLPADIVSKETFSLIYQWMLHQDADNHQVIRRDNVLDVYKASQYLGIKELEKQCSAFIENSEVFFEDKAFLLYLEARRHGNKNIMNLMVPRVQRFFLTLVSAKEFVELSLEEVCAFLISDYASVHNEMEMLMAAVRWLSHEWSARRLFAVDVMRCVRFQFIDSKSLLLLRRTKQPPEVERVVDIPDVTKMMDDAIAYHTIRAGNENKPEEELDNELRKLNLSHPATRNWTGTHKDCRDYREFLQDLSRYRSKHRMEVKKSRMEMRTRDLDEDDFLSYAVLPENVQKRVSLLQNEDRSRHGHLPKLPPREYQGLKKVLGEDESEKDEQIQTRPCLKGRREYSRPVRHSPEGNREDDRKRKIADSLVRVSSKEDLDKAARKIQRAYRGYTMRKTPSKDSEETRAARAVPSRSASDPNIPSSLSVTRDVSHRGKTEPRLEMHTGVETVFTFGGFDPYKNPHTVDTGSAIFKYVLASNSWERCGELPQPRHYHGACLYRGKIYVAGGKNPSYVSNEGVSRKVWRYDPDYRTWSRVADLLRARRAFGFVICCNRLYAVGGRDAKNRVLSSVEKYDPDADCWMQVRRMQEPRTGAGVCEFEGGVWAAGGLTGPDCRGTRTVERYDPTADAWSYCAPLRYVCAFPALLPMEGRLHLVAGAIGHDQIVGSGRHIDVLDPCTGSWCLSTTLAKCRHAHAAAFLRGVPRPEPGHLLVLGGIVSRRESAIDDVECWRVREDVFVTGVAPLPAAACGFPALVLPCRTF